MIEVRRGCEPGEARSADAIGTSVGNGGGACMQVSFKDDKLYQVVMDPVQGDWPSDLAFQDVEVLIADLMAASNLLEVPLGVPDLSHTSTHDFELEAGQTVVLRCRVDHVTVRRLSNYDPDWKWIDRVMIIGWRENDQ
jgi:hypothetical protein